MAELGNNLSHVGVVAEDMWYVVEEDMWWMAGLTETKAKPSISGLAELGKTYFSTNCNDVGLERKKDM